MGAVRLIDLTDEQLTAIVRAAIKAEREAENDSEVLYTNEQAAKMLNLTVGGLLKRVSRKAIVPDVTGERDSKGNRYSMATINAAKKRGRR